MRIKKYKKEEKRVIKQIAKMLKKGHDKKELRSLLKKEGWPLSVLDKAMLKVKVGPAKKTITNCHSASCHYNAEKKCRYPRPLEHCSIRKGGKQE